MKGTLGILGGMGALASAEFLKSIYEYNSNFIEQQTPIAVLVSDPTFPDRTQALLSGNDELLIESLIKRLGQLYFLGADRIVICCVTLHYALASLPEYLRSGIISLIDVALAEAIEARRNQLVLCSDGVRAARIFESHDLWPLAKDYITFCDSGDQQLVHSSLYKYKVTDVEQPLLSHLDYLLAKYKVDSFIAACTELHMLTKFLTARRSGRYQFIDPLLTIAKDLPNVLGAEPEPARDYEVVA